MRILLISVANERCFDDLALGTRMIWRPRHSCASYSHVEQTAKRIILDVSESHLAWCKRITLWTFTTFHFTMVIATQLLSSALWAFISSGTSRVVRVWRLPMLIIGSPAYSQTASLFYRTFFLTSATPSAASASCAFVARQLTVYW